MTPILHLTLRSVRNRRLSVGLTLLTVALSVALLLGVERLRTETRASFASTIPGADLIVGARSGPVQLLLYSVFRIGNATNNIGWQSVEMLRESGMVLDRHDTQWVRYRRNPDLAPEIAAVIDAVLDAERATERKVA